MKNIAITFLFAVCAMSYGFTQTLDVPAGLKVADEAPSFSAKSHSGEIVHLDSMLRKGPVVLFF